MVFFRQFLKHPLQIGSIIPSSRFLEQRVLQSAGVASARTIVELGPGTGGTTRAILRTMPPQAKLLSIEINPYFHSLISGIQNDGFIAHLGDACELEDITSTYDLGRIDAVISGIPFSTMSYETACRVLNAISALLTTNGRFVAYQVRSRVASLCRPYLGPEENELEPLNIPPMRVYQWVKKEDRAWISEKGSFI
ncbi:MAG: methyltransferase type 12 [Deltaproteobacteria bacterium]|nr:methyltransferase type 12 [Deltaproteobacteria bacterium]